MSELISGIDVPRLIKEDVSIQYRAASSGAFKEGQWSDFILDEDEEEFTIGDLINDGRWDFRRKPSTITINGVEVPAPFEPRVGEKYWFIADYVSSGYSDTKEGTGINSSIGKWKTEEEIKQVVAALRSIFNAN